jgi:hypothetical protein
VPHRAKQPAERDAHIIVVLDEDQGQRTGNGQEALRESADPILQCGVFGSSTEQGKWRPDDPLSKHIPEFANLQVYFPALGGRGRQ